MTGTGNPNVFTTFKGRYTLVASPSQTVDTAVVMLSCTNDVQPLGDWTLDNYSAGETIATLPTECCPGKLVKIPVVVNATVDILTIGVNGEITLPHSYDNATLYMSGINFNISDRWYAKENV